MYQLNELCTDLLGEILRYGDVAISKQVCTSWNHALERVPTPPLELCDYVSSVSLLEWARENGCRWNELTWVAVVKGGHLDVLKWAHENDCPWHLDTCIYAVEEGHFNILEWARDKRASLNARTCAVVALRGQLDTLKRLFEYGFSWNEWTITYAICGNHLDVLEWVLEKAEQHGMEECKWTTSHCSMMANGSKKMRKWARTRGCCFTTQLGHECPLLHN